MNHTWKTWAGAGLLAAMGLGAAVTAQADAFISLTRTGNFTGGSSLTVVPLSNTGQTATGQFFNSAGRRFIVSYTAECAKDGTSGWVDVDIRLINVFTGAIFTLPPTNAGGSDAFCSADHTTGFDGWTMAAVNAVATGLPEGTYRVQVLARATSGSFWLGDSSLVVWR